MQLDIYQVDAFAKKVFEGNPAAVIPLNEWLDDRLLQKIAAENNLSETAFFVPAGDGYELRWFTPVDEVDLCGHATLATAHVMFEHLNIESEQLTFKTRSGDLIVTKSEFGLSMDFPASIPEPVEAPKNLLLGLGIEPVCVLAAFDYIVELGGEKELQQLQPDLNYWNHLDLRGVVVTAPGLKQDFVTRCFFPKLGVNEDPVTGSAHCEVAPLWAKKLGKTQLSAKQLSARTGYISCLVENQRVILSGEAKDYMKGKITVVP